MAVIKTNGGYNALPISYKRGNPIPLDKSSVWYDYDLMVAYAQSDATAYVGQILSLVNADDASAVAYIILNEAGDLEALGAAAITNDIENIQLELTNIGEDIESILTQIGAPANAETGESASGLYAEIDSKVASAVANAAHLSRKVVENYEAIEAYMAEHDDAEQYIFMVPLGVSDYDNKYEEYVVINGVIEPVGSWSVDLDDYVKEEDLLFTAVDSNAFTISAGVLGLKPIAMESVSGLTELNTSVGNLSTEVGNLSNDLSGLSTTVQNLGTEIQTLKEQTLPTLSTKVGNLETAINTGLEEVNGKITELDEALKALDDKFVSIEDFEKIVGNIDDLLLKNETISAQINEIKTQLTWQTLQ